MEPPASLPSKLYLLAYDLDKDRLGRNAYLGRALRAAALAELYRAGRITDAAGKVHVAAPARSGSHSAGSRSDPLQAAMLAQISAAGRPRSWQHWIDKGHRGAATTLRDLLEAGRWIRVRRRTVLGFIPVHTVTVRDRAMVRQLQRAVRRTLRGEILTNAAEPDVATLAALAAAGELRTMASGRERRAHRKNINALGEVGGPAVAALKKAVKAAQAASASV